MGVLADAGEHIQHLAAVWFGILHAVCCNQWQPLRPRQIDQLTVGLFFAAHKMPLNFDVNIFATEYMDEVEPRPSRTTGILNRWWRDRFRRVAQIRRQHRSRPSN